MHQHAALVVASILTAGKSRDYSAMGCSAKRVLQVGVSFARKCGTCFNSMPVLAKMQIAMCRGAGVYSFHFCSVSLALLCACM
jgi:hypothetical protein